MKLYRLTLSPSEFKWLEEFPGGLCTKVEKQSDEIKVVSTMSLSTAKELQEWEVSWTSKAFGGILHSDDGLLESKFVVEIGAKFKASSESEQILLNVTRNESKLWALSKIKLLTEDDDELEAYFDSLQSLESGEGAIMMPKSPSGERYESGPWKLGTLSLKGYYRGGRTTVTTGPFEATFTIVATITPPRGKGGHAVATS